MIDDIKPPARTPSDDSRSTPRNKHPSGDETGVASGLAPFSVPIKPDEPVSKETKPKPSKRKKILLAGLVLLIVGAIVSSWFFVFNKPAEVAPVTAQNTTPKKIEPPKPTTLASPLTGVQVAPELAKKPITAVMIENSPDSRPQSGLRDAGVIFEAIAEGGITRFATLFQEGQPAYIGPVRSIRPYYIDWYLPFDASLAHVGGSRDALDIVRGPGMKDLDQFFNSGYYQRISERYAPHNVYTSFEKLNALNTAKGFTDSAFTPWKRKADKKAETPTVKAINFNVSGFYYNVHYDYDPASNSYLRSQAGKPHVDITSQKDPSPRQLNPKVVIALVMPFDVVRASDGWRTSYATTGSGPMIVFQDGTAIGGTWSKKDMRSQFIFKDSAGNDFSFNAGQTWVTILDSLPDATYGP